jgi:ABC-2 type transport system permease protein
MNRAARLRAEAGAAVRSFLRRRTAVFFTFFFPVVLVLIFGVLVGSTAGGLFSEPTGYYVPGYLAVVVLFTPLSRVSSEVARHREGARFEKLQTTPLTRTEWLAAQTLVNVALVAAASVVVIGLLVGLTGANVNLSPLLLVLVPLATVLFCGVGAVLGRVADSRDGAITAANAVGLPLLFLSETFVPSTMLPAWFTPVVSLSPLTYFARATRAVTYTPPGPEFDVPPYRALVWPNLAALAVLAGVGFALGAWAVPSADD